MTERYLGIDIGGTSIKLGLVDDQGDVLSRVTGPSCLEHGLQAGLESIADLAHRALEEAACSWSDVRGIGAACPGTLDIPAGIIMHPFNLPGWEDLPLRDILAKRFDRPTVLQNDANAAAFGEYVAGSGKGAHSLVMWTLGTGIGAGIVLGGRIWEGAHSHAGECGHIVIQMIDGPRSPFGIHGSLELYAGGKALVQRCLDSIADHPNSPLSSIPREEIDPAAIARCADEGDPFADSLVMDIADALAIGTVNIMHTIDPGTILLGGAMTFGRDEAAIGRRFIERLRTRVREIAFPVLAEKTSIEYASLGNDAGFIGAALCAHNAK